MTNRFKGLDLVDTVPEELWTEVRNIVQETGIKIIPMEMKCKKRKMAVWGSLTKFISSIIRLESRNYCLAYGLQNGCCASRHENNNIITHLHDQVYCQ